MQYHLEPLINRHQRRDLCNVQSQNGPSQPPPMMDDGNDSDGPQRSYNVDDDDDNLSFLEGLKTVHVPGEFMTSNIPIYDRKGDLARHHQQLQP